MRRSLLAVAVALCTGLVFAISTHADTPTAGGGLTRVVHDGTLTGSGTTAAPLGITGGVVGDITGVTAGTGITGGGTSGTVTVTLNETATTCGASQAFTANTSTGVYTCSTVGDITSVGATANMGLTGGATSGAATLGLLSTCADGQVLKSGSTGTTWTCANDSTGGGITNSAGANVIMKSDGTNAVASSASDNGTTWAINTNKVTVTEASGNTAIAGTLDVVGAISENTVRVLSAVGTGLSKTTNTVNLNLAGASCSAGQAVTAIGSTGTGTCSSVGTVTTGSSLTLNTLPRASGSSTLVDSAVTDNGSTIVLGRAVSTSSSIGVGSYVDAASYVGAGSFGVYLDATGLNAGFNTNATGTLYLNPKSYQDGITQFRDTKVQDGKGADIATFTGSTKAVSLAGALDVVGAATFDGNVTVGDAITDVVTMAGKITSNIHFTGTTPTYSCGGTVSGAPSITGNNTVGVIHTGDGATGTCGNCRITFASPAFTTNAPVCQLTPVGTSAHTVSPRICAAATGTLDVRGDGGVDINYFCPGRI